MEDEELDELPVDDLPEEEEIEEAADADEGEGDGDEDYSEIERLALEAGWKPGDKWKGEGHKDAASYLKDAAKAARNSRREARELQERMDALEGMNRVALDRQEEAIWARAEELKAAAIERGGRDAVGEVAEIEAIRDEELAKLSGVQAQPNIKLNALDKRAIAQNAAWIISEEAFSDPELVEEADEALDLYTTEFNRVLEKTGSQAEAHERAGVAIKKAFPHHYRDGGQARGRRMPEVSRGFSADRGGRAPVRLPPEAMAAARDSVKRGIFGSIEEYAEVYAAELKKGRRR